MQPENFVTELQKAAPSEADLVKCGLSSQEAHQAMSRYFCVRRYQRLVGPNGSDEVLELLKGWDLSKVQVGMVRFPVEPFELPGGICLGCVEADPLLLLLNSGEVVVYELGTKEHLLWRVAQNGSTLLDALVIAAQFLSKRGVEKIDFDDNEAARSVALACAAAAGGERYLDFYKMLIGAE